MLLQKFLDRRERFVGFNILLYHRNFKKWETTRSLGEWQIFSMEFLWSFHRCFFAGKPVGQGRKMSAVFTGYKEGLSVETLLKNGPFFNSGHSYPLPQSNPTPSPQKPMSCFSPSSPSLTTNNIDWGVGCFFLAFSRIKK